MFDAEHFEGDADFDQNDDDDDIDNV